MKFLDRIKTRFGSWFLNKELKGSIRKPKLATFGNATSVALLYKGDDQASLANVKKYVSYLKEEEGIRDVVSMGFFDVKESPDFLGNKVGFQHFTRNDLNWYKKPAGKEVQHFMNIDFDILIDLSQNEWLPLRFVLAASKAKFKVGRYSKDNEAFYDLMIELPQEVKMSTYIKQINHYLDLMKENAAS